MLPPSSVDPADMSPEWMEPSGRMASHRSHTVVAPRSTWYSQLGASRRSSIRYASARWPLFDSANSTSGVPRNPVAMRPFSARTFAASASPMRIRSSCGAMSNSSASAAPVWVVIASSPHVRHVASATRSASAAYSWAAPGSPTSLSTSARIRAERT